jgi:hypothetical protein
VAPCCNALQYNCSFAINNKSHHFLNQHKQTWQKTHLCDSIDPLSHTPSHTKCHKGLKSNRNPKQPKQSIIKMFYGHDGFFQALHPLTLPLLSTFLSFSFYSTCNNLPKFS